jgi:hypothetical protein
MHVQQSTTTTTGRPHFRVLRGGLLSPAPTKLTTAAALAAQLDRAITYSAVEALRALYPDWDDADLYAEARDMRVEGDRDLTPEDMLAMLAEFRIAAAH